MKKIISTLTVFLISFITFAQEAPTQVIPKITDIPNHEGWINDATVASQLSQKTGAPILLFFTGSDWCGWCVRLHNEVLSKAEFKAWALQKGIILLEVDFPRRKQQSDALKQQNASLQQQFEVRGFPTVYVIKGQSFAKLGYEAGGPKAWIAKVESQIQL